jgi:hypothetical protein
MINCINLSVFEKGKENMGAFICQISENDWDIAKVIGLYGNREKKSDGSELSEVVIMSIIRDLIPIQIGDKVFFHVVKTKGESRIHGLYQSYSQAFYDPSKVWENFEEAFPYRFCFRPYDKYKEFTRKDAYIYVSELYEKIESRDVWSIATLESEMNLEGRAVRKIAIEDAEVIESLILKQPKFREKEDVANKFYIMPSESIFLDRKIKRIGDLENSIKAYFMSELKNKSSYMIEKFGNIQDYMNETFVAQTTRKLFDILVISKKTGGNKFYIIEAKTDYFNEDSLAQLLHYLDLFRHKDNFDQVKDEVKAVALAKRFSNDFLALISKFKYYHIIDNIEFIQYRKGDSDNTASFTSINLDTTHNQMDLFAQKMIKVKSGFSPESLYENENFNIENFFYADIKIKKVMIIENDAFRFLKEFLIFERNDLTNDFISKSIKTVNEYIANEKNYDYSSSSIIFRGKCIDNAACQIIREYNNLFKRPDIILSSLE